MKLVIDIPEGMLDELNTCKFPIQDAYRLCDVVEKGQPLPKGHGRLIDASSLDLERLYRENDDGGFSLVHTESEYKTIIEADKEGEECI